MLIGADDLRRVLRGCKEQGDSTEKCSVCEDKFYLSDNGFCYAKVDNCLSYIADVCLSCESPYVLKNGVCSSNCGDLCQNWLMNLSFYYKFTILNLSI